MYELSGRIQGLAQDFATKRTTLTLSINEEEASKILFDELRECEKLSIKIDKYREKRSLNANNYAWKLMTEIGNKLRANKEDVYLLMLKRYGQSEIISVLSAIPIRKYVKYCEEAGESTLNGKLFKHYKIFKGSSEFDTREMSIFLDGVISEAKELGIPTETPEQIAKLKSLWGGMSVKHILSFSGGKDSTFLLLELIRRKYPLDEVVFFDTGWEFPAMYEHIEKCKKICEKRGIKFVTLHPEKPFDYFMFDHITQSGKKGYSWCGGNCRWGTTFKTQALDKNAQLNNGNIVYIGIAADETARLEKERAEFKRFPLAEWGITEAECLRGCYAAGFTWGGMYMYLDRLSCKFCKNKNLRELRNIRKIYPEVWNELKDYQRRTDRPYKGEGQSVFDLEKRFAFEDERTAQGLSITSREFHRELKSRLGGGE